MGTRRQPSGQFLRRLKSYNEPTEKQRSWIRKYKDSDAWIWTEVAAVVVGLAFVIPTAVALWIDLDDRKLQRETAVETLELGANLSGTNMLDADLSGADLAGAYLLGAYLLDFRPL